MKKLAAFFVFFVANAALACDIKYTVNLNTHGQSVRVELRQGKLGRSWGVETQRSSGGIVQFYGLCPHTYFLAIGDGDWVDVTPTRAFEEGFSYESNITTTRRRGNVQSKKRSQL